MPVYEPDASMTVIGTPRTVRLSILAGCRLSIGSEHLAFPALDVGVDAAALAGSEVVHDALGDALIAGSQRNRVGRRAHRSRRFGLPACRCRPADTRRRFGKHDRRRRREHSDTRQRRLRISDEYIAAKSDRGWRASVGIDLGWECGIFCSTSALIPRAISPA